MSTCVQLFDFINSNNWLFDLIFGRNISRTTGSSKSLFDLFDLCDLFSGGSTYFRGTRTSRTLVFSALQKHTKTQTKSNIISFAAFFNSLPIDMPD